MINNVINISFINEKLLDTLYTNPNKATVCIRNNPYDTKWLKEICDVNPFELRKQKINNFELKMSTNGKYKEVEIENAIILYEHLKELPRYVLIDERLWAWLELDKFYRIAIQAMPVSRDSSFEGRWIFKRGKKRGIWFNEFSRSYFWTEFTVDENRKDRYELTRFAFENIERIRHLTFDSKYRSVVFSTIKAEKDIFDKYINNPEFKNTLELCEKGIDNSNIYTYIRKSLSLYGSARILDFMDEEDLYNIVYEKLEKAINEVHKGNLGYLKINF